MAQVKVRQNGNESVKNTFTFQSKVYAKLEFMADKLSLPKSSILTIAIEKLWQNNEFWNREDYLNEKNEKEGSEN